MRFALLAALGLLSACAVSPTAPVADNNISEVTEQVPAKLNLSRQSFANLPAWQNDNFDQFHQAYQKSCNTILKRGSQNNFYSDPRFGKNQEWQILCRQYKELNHSNINGIRQFFEQNYTPYLVSNNNESEGLFTGYYEASLKGSRTKQGVYQTPLRSRPDDLVMVQLGEFRDELKGQRIAGRVVDGKLKPYETHAEIIQGGLPRDMDDPIVWVDDPVDAFFLQIQGSGVVALDDGTTMRVGYAGQNGHPYYAIGRELIARGYLTKDTVSMQSIREWLGNNPNDAVEIMTTNKSYVFFGELTQEGPIGGSGLVLTPERSLAIDRSLLPYHAPFWVDLEASDTIKNSINRLMVTQDTGGAIRGPVRGDFFWGYGLRAETMSGDMKSKGRYWILMPNKL